MTHPQNPAEVLDAVLATLISDFATSRSVADAFRSRSDLTYDDVDAVWRKYWGRGLHDED